MSTKVELLVVMPLVLAVLMTAAILDSNGLAAGFVGFLILCWLCNLPRLWNEREPVEPVEPTDFGAL